MTARRKHARGFTVLEVVIVLAILSICATMAADLVSESEAAMRADRAARECLTALRYARNLAFTTGNAAGVRFDTAAKTFHVWQNNTPATPIANSMAAGGTYVIDFKVAKHVAGVSMSPSIAGDATTPFDVQFTPLGATANTGTVTFTYGGKSKVVSITAVGDPTLK